MVCRTISFRECQLTLDGMHSPTSQTSYKFVSKVGKGSNCRWNSRNELENQLVFLALQVVVGLAVLHTKKEVCGAVAVSFIFVCHCSIVHLRKNISVCIYSRFYIKHIYMYKFSYRPISETLPYNNPANVP